MLYFTTLPRSHRCTDFYKIWCGGIAHGRNHIFTISYQIVKGFWFCEGSNFAISHRKAWSPLIRCLHYRGARHLLSKNKCSKVFQSPSDLTKDVRPLPGFIFRGVSPPSPSFPSSVSSPLPSSLSYFLSPLPINPSGFEGCYKLPQPVRADPGQ